MKNIRVLGTGCTNCKTTIELIRQVAEEKSVAIELDKVEEIQEIMKYAVLSTPAVVVDGKVVHAGGIPGRDEVRAWL